MNAFSEGDLVEAVKGERVIRDRIHVITDSPIFNNNPYLGEPRMFGESSIESLRANGYTLTLVEKAAPALPTEAGWYRSSGLGSDQIDGLLHLGARGDWTWVGNMFAVNPDALTYKQARQHLPLIRLEPVADTAKKVLDAVREFMEARSNLHHRNVTTFHRTTFIKDLDMLAKQFGVTS